MQRGQFALAGTLVVDGKATAFLRETQGGKSRRVAQGESVNGMTVVEIKPDRVKLVLGDESEELPLKIATGPRTTIQPVVAAPGAGGPITATAQQQATPNPAIPGARDVAEVLAERRRAARAAGDGRAGPAAGRAHPHPERPARARDRQHHAAGADGSAEQPIRLWQGVYQRYQQPRR